MTRVGWGWVARGGSWRESLYTCRNSCISRLMCFHLTGLRLEHSNKLNTIKGVGFNAEELSSAALKYPLLWIQRRIAISYLAINPLHYNVTVPDDFS